MPSKWGWEHWAWEFLHTKHLHNAGYPWTPYYSRWYLNINKIKMAYPAGRVAISNKILFHSLLLNIQMRAVPSRLPLTNLTNGKMPFIVFHKQNGFLQCFLYRFHKRSYCNLVILLNALVYLWFLEFLTNSIRWNLQDIHKVLCNENNTAILYTPTQK